ncbi:MAG: hypothetical protein U0V74_00335 [Chitinophagales bacterium]
MSRQIKHIARIALIALTGLMLITSLPSCKANKCDCPTFGGHRLKH